MSLPEGLLWRAIKARKADGLHFRKQHPIGPYILDFYCHTAGLGIELDGAVHFAQVDDDRERDRVLAAHGLRILRFTNDEFEKHLPEVLERIEQALVGEPPGTN